MTMKHDTFCQFDNACIAGDLHAIRGVLATEKPSGGQLNAALRHAAYYTVPDSDTRENVIDELIEHGARVDWSDRGIETIVNAINSKSVYLLKSILNVCDGDEAKLGVALKKIQGKHDAEWAERLVQTRMLGMFHIGL